MNLLQNILSPLAPWQTQSQQLRRVCLMNSQTIYKKALQEANNSRIEFENAMYQIITEPSQPHRLKSKSSILNLDKRIQMVSQSLKSTKVTGAALDIEVWGCGFLSLQMNGQVVYTRGGSFKQDSNGRIEDLRGHILLPEIFIPTQAYGIHITSSGLVSYLDSKNGSPQEAGCIKLAIFANSAGLKSIGSHLYVPTTRSGPPELGIPQIGLFGSLQQGRLRNYAYLHDMLENLSLIKP